MRKHYRSEHAGSERLPRAMLVDPAMQGRFHQTLAALLPESRARIAEVLDRHLPAVVRAMVKRAIVDRDGEAMHLVFDILARRTGNARMRALTLEALHREIES